MNDQDGIRTAIAIVDFNDAGPSQRVFARIRPRVLLETDSASVLSDRDRRQQFMSEGMVYWPNPPAAAVPGSAWIVTCRLHDPQKGKDHYWVGSNDARPAIELLEVPSQSDGSLRRQLARGQLPLGKVPAPKFMVAYPGRQECWIGPIESRDLTWEQDSVIAELPTGGTGFAPVHRVDASDSVAFRDKEGERIFLLPWAKQEVVGQFSTQDDEALLASLVPRIRRLEPAVAEALGVTQQAYRSYCELLASKGSHISGVDRQKDAERARVIGDLLASIDASQESATALINAIADRPSFQKRIEERIDDLARTAAAGRVFELEPRVPELELQIAALSGTLQAGEKRLQVLESERRALQKAIESLATDAEERVRLLLSASLAGRFLVRNQTADRDPAPTTLEGPPPRAIRTKDDLIRTSDLIAMSDGLSRSELKWALGTALGTGFLALVGSRQERLAAAISMAIAQDATCAVLVSGDMFSVGDLLNAAVTPRTPTGTAGLTLGDFLACMQSRKLTALVQLRGANLAPPEAILQELIRLVQEVDGQAAIAWVDRSGTARALQLSSRVVFVAHLAGGKTRFPFSPPVADGVPIIDTDAIWPDADDPVDTANRLTGNLDGQAWRELANGFAAQDTMSSLASPQAELASRRMRCALGFVGFSSADAAMLAYLALSIGRVGLEALRNRFTSGEGPLAAVAASVLDSCNASFIEACFALDPENNSQ